MLTMPNKYDYLIVTAFVAVIVVVVFVINTIAGPTCPPC